MWLPVAAATAAAGFAALATSRAWNAAARFKRVTIRNAVRFCTSDTLNVNAMQ